MIGACSLEQRADATAPRGSRIPTDACRLGRLWLDAGVHEGGVVSQSTPAVLRGWPHLMYNEHAKCGAATKLLKPALIRAAG